VTERLLDGWVGRYVSMRAAGGVFRGRVETVGSDSIFFQITTTPDRRRSYPPLQFFPWHSIESVRLEDEKAPGDEG
jgi:hypothetical protein